MNYVRISYAVLLLIYSASAHLQSAVQPEIPAPEKARIASLAKEALSAKDITQAQYQSTMTYLNSRPCVGVDRALSKVRKAKLSAVIAKQEGVKKLEVLASFRFEAWQILYIAQENADDNFLFYAGEPLTSKPKGTWSGGASIFETAEIQMWVSKNVTGIPLPLASCFAWHVTLNRR